MTKNAKQNNTTEMKETTMQNTKRYVYAILALLFGMMSFLTGCRTTMQEQQYPAAGMLRGVPKMVTIRNKQLQELSEDAMRAFDDPAEQVHFANERIRRCQNLLMTDDTLTKEEKQEVCDLKMFFERMSLEGQVNLATLAYQENLLHCNNIVILKCSMHSFATVLKRMMERPELWSYEELCRISTVKASMEADLATLEKKLAESLRFQLAALKEMRRTFENNASADYIRKAESLYLRQKRKWFNWKWLGCWRDDVDALYLSADYCHRVMEGEYVSEIPYNSAADLFNKVMKRCSKKERTFYQNSHRNTVTALKDLDEYPEDHTQELAEEMALGLFRESKGLQVPQNNDEQPIKDVSVNR